MRTEKIIFQMKNKIKKKIVQEIPFNELKIIEFNGFWPEMDQREMKKK